MRYVRVKKLKIKVIIFGLLIRSVRFFGKLERRILVEYRPTIHNLVKHFFVREDYFPLTLTLSPLGERGKSGTDLMSYMKLQSKDNKCSCHSERSVAE
jgi:hypothetical protein